MNQITDYTKYNKIAVMGGTFNPIHTGHLVAAEAVRQQLGIERVIFVPSGKPPHKESDPMLTEHRYLMTVLATVTNPHFEVSRIEVDRTGLTYTVDTITELKRRCREDCRSGRHKRDTQMEGARKTFVHVRICGCDKTRLQQQ